MSKMAQEPDPFPEDETSAAISAVMLRGEWVRAVNEAASAVQGVVGKGGKNSHQGYRFVGHEHVVRHAREAMNDAGLVVGAPAASASPELHSNGKFSIWVWRFRIPVYHSGGHVETFEVVATTQGNDKAAFVASTAADRTLRLRLLGLAGGEAEDPEHDSHGGGVSF